MSVATDYAAFLADKGHAVALRGMSDTPALGAHLFPFQLACVEFGLRAGSWGLFLDTGMGKTLCELEWCKHAAAASNGRALILTPLAVAGQIVREGQRFGYDVRLVREASDAGDGINVCNYDRLHLLDPDAFGAVALDESSILKNFTGATSRGLRAAFAGHRWRMLATATPAPNDHTELAQSSAFLGVATRDEMLSRYFINDSGDTKSWRLKGHAVADFWRWLSSWSRMATHPSDLGFEMDGFNLPPLRVVRHEVESHVVWPDGTLFGGNVAATEIHDLKRQTSHDRAAMVASLVAAEPAEPWIVWCDTDYEADALRAAIPHAVDVRGSDSADFKEDAIQWFTGDLCVCKNHLFRAKLATWHGRENTQTHGERSTNRTRKSESEGGDKGEAQKKTASTCVDTTEPTQGGSRSRQRSERSGTADAESDTQAILSTERSKRHRLGQETHPPRETAGYSDSSGSDLTSSTRSWRGRAGGAPYAEGASPTSGADSTSTTATQAEEFAESCVRRAISDSESSETTPADSSEQRCICGHRSGQRVLVSKPSIFGFGLNLQHCARMAFAGRSYSYETWYQAVRRAWRFGQAREVTVHLAVASGEDAIGRVIDRKADDHEEMKRAMCNAMREAIHGDDGEAATVVPTGQTASGRRFALHNADCVEVTQRLADESIDLSVYSPPFANLFVYSDHPADMGNCTGDAEFLEHYRYLVRELCRATVPGRLSAVHCSDLPLQKWRDGAVGIRDFSGAIIAAHQDAGWVLHSRVTIWKSPVTEMTRTKALGLLYKQLRKDSARSRAGMPDYLLVFRKDGENPRPIAHTPDDFPLDQWQEWASPVWMTVDQEKTLNVRSAREDRDERHLCPLQLDVIERAVVLWSNPGDLVFSPFAGIGSEGYMALRLGRRFEGCELKPAYWKQAAEYLDSTDRQQGLFEAAS